MRVSTRFPIAVHALMLIAAFSGQRKVNSDLVADSTGVNAVIIRNIFIQLKRAGLIEVSPGPGGTVLAKQPEQINLWDIFAAVETENTDDIFKFHENISPYCPVGGNIYELLHSHLDEAVAALRKELADVTLADILNELHQKVSDLPPL